MTTFNNQQVKQNLSLAKLTSWRVGGDVEIYASPSNRQELAQLLHNYGNKNIYFIGLGSNLLIRDSGVAGLVIDTKKGLCELFCEDNLVYAGAGVASAKFARFCARNNLQGAEFFAGIPGTIGGALKMNAGCFGGETWNLVEYVDTIDADGNIKRRNPIDFNFSYRACKFDRKEWFIGAMFRLENGSKEDSLQIIKELLARRADTQPTGDHSCGSVFKNPPGDFAGRLIEDAGLKGYAVGGAQVSNKHANFIINENSATATDIEALIEHVKEAVLAKHCIALEPEVQIIGEK